MDGRSFCLLLLALITIVNGRNFLGANPELKAAAVRDELRGVIAEVFGHGHGVNDARFSKIRSILEPMFRSLPKNGRGRLSTQVMRYAVQRYFSERHGWIVKGFEPHAVMMNISDVNDGMQVLQSELPSYIRSALEEKFSHDGFTLESTAVMIAAVERLTFDEVIKGVELSFLLNSIPLTQGLSEDQFSEVLTSYLITEMLEGNAQNISQHMDDKANIDELYPHWDDTYVLLLDVAGNDGFERRQSVNPFLQKQFFFEDVARIAQRVSEEFGPWSNHECRDMKGKLAGMDVHETGRVKLSDFYGSSKDGAWQFREASDYLRMVGALDESSRADGPQVIIPNYIAGMNNCITSAPYYQICCLNECDQVYHLLESAISAPTASAAVILWEIESMIAGGRAFGLEAKNLTASLRSWLVEVEVLNGGNVPLHGRLFKQWLHYVFPRECPYPHAAGTLNPLNPIHLEKLAGEDVTTAKEEEVQQHLESEAARRTPSPEAGRAMWNLQEELLNASTPSDATGASYLRSFLRTCAHLGMAGGFLILVLKEVPRISSLMHPEKSKRVEYNV